MRIEIDTNTSDNMQLRATAAYLLTLAGDISLDRALDESVAEIEAARKPTPTPIVPTGTPPSVPHAPSKAPAAPTPPHAPSTDPYPPPPAPVPPPPASNVLPFPSAPQASAVTATAPDAPTMALPASGATVPATASAEYDAAGMPWDARIHQKAQGRKKDGTWKLQKGIDPALVQSVTAELAARKLAAAAPTAALAEAMAANPTIPAPAVAAATPADAGAPMAAPAAPTVPAAPPPPPPVEVPAPVATAPVTQSPAVSPSPAVSAFPDFMRRVTELTRAGKIAPTDVLGIVQRNGAPNMQSLAQPAYLSLIPACLAELDAVTFGK